MSAQADGVNVLDNGHCKNGCSDMVSPMTELWITRLLEGVDRENERGASNREISRRAGVGPSFIYDLRQMKKTPSVENVVKLARALDLSLVYVFTGMEVTSELQELMEIYAALPPSRRQVLLSLVRELKGTEPE